LTYEKQHLLHLLHFTRKERTFRSPCETFYTFLRGTDMSNLDCFQFLDQTLAPLCEIRPTVKLYKQAINVQTDTDYSFYVSIIIAATLDYRYRTVYSENLHGGHEILGLTIVIPF